MVYQKLTGTVCVKEREFQSEFSTMIHHSGYFYARSVGQVGIEQIQIFVSPFTSNMLTRPLNEANAPLVYELQGNHIGNVRFGSDNKEGEWRTWDLRKVVICVKRFSNGMSIRFEIGTERGACTFQGSIDESTIGKLLPVDYWFMVFVPIDILQEFLRGESEKWIEPDSLNAKFIESLTTAGLKPYIS